MLSIYLKLLMLYQERLKKWAIVRVISDSKPIILERFRSIADAEGHLKVLQNQMPHEQLMVIFDRPSIDVADSPSSTETTPDSNEVSAS